MEKVSKLEDGLLDVGHKLYSTLNNTPPSWWNLVKNDKELYVEVRKNNILDIYYRGGRAAELKFNKKTQSISVTAHPKYLGHDNEYDKDNCSYYKKSDKDGTYKPIYQNCEDWLTSERLNELKANITKNYSGVISGEDTSEKYIQGDLIVNGREKYLDSEFAHRFHEGERNTLRIDLIRIDGYRLVFEELKRIGDHRLCTSSNRSPEILTQIDNYKSFLTVNKIELKSYYQKLYRIKEFLGLPIPAIDDINKLYVDVEPKLIIKNNYIKKSNKRDIRIKCITESLKKINVTPQFI